MIAWLNDRSAPAGATQQQASTNRRGRRPWRPRKREGPLLRTQVCRRIQEMILRGECAAGSKLRQLALADRFGVAQGVVREALLELELNGWVQSIDRRGAYVTRIDPAMLAQALQVRTMHEALAARLCCDRVTRADIRELERLAEQAYQVAAVGDGRGKVEAAALDRDFHLGLIPLSGNELLARLSENYRFRAAAGAATPRERTVVRAEHLAILRAIQDGRADEAERLVREHITADAGYADKSCAAISSMRSNRPSASHRP